MDQTAGNIDYAICYVQLPRKRALWPRFKGPALILNAKPPVFTVQFYDGKIATVNERKIKPVHGLVAEDFEEFIEACGPNAMLQIRDLETEAEPEDPQLDPVAYSERLSIDWTGPSQPLMDGELPFAVYEDSDQEEAGEPPLIDEVLDRLTPPPSPTGEERLNAVDLESLPTSEDAAYKRIQAARAARELPQLFEALADGRLHLTGLCLLAPHLTAENAEELIEGATHRRKSEIEGFLVRRFEGAGTEAPAMIRTVPPTSDRSVPPLAPGQVEGEGAQPASPSPERFRVEFTIGKGTYEKLRYAQALLSHAVPTGDVAQVLDRALDALIADLEAARGVLQYVALSGELDRPQEIRPKPRRLDEWGFAELTTPTGSA